MNRKELALPFLALSLALTIGCSADGKASNGVTTPKGEGAASAKPSSQLEGLDPKIVKAIDTSLLNLHLYSQELRESVATYWEKGTDGGTVSLYDSPSAPLIIFKPSLIQPNLSSLAATEFNSKTIALVGGRYIFLTTLEGKVKKGFADTYPQPERTQLEAMNRTHEYLITIGLLEGMGIAGQGLGFSFAPRTEPFSAEDGSKAREIYRYINGPIRESAEAIAEAMDYILTYPLLEKMEDGNPSFDRSKSGKMLPSIKGIIFEDSGLTHLTDSTIGPILRKFSSWGELTKTYSRLDQIPGAEEYLKQIRAYYRAQKGYRPQG